MTSIIKTLAVLLCLSVVLCAQVTTGQTVKNNVLVDHDFKFRLRAPESSRLLDEAAAIKIIPDSQAGLILNTSFYTIVIAEQAPEGDIASFSESIIEQIALEEKTVEKREELQFAGRDAIRTMVKGTTQGIPFRFQHVIFMNSGYLYQIICWGMAKTVAVDGSTFAPCLRSFSLLKGKVTGRKSTFVTADLAGVGWKYKNKKFLSAPLGIEVISKAPWRVVVGDELDTMNEQAEVGLLHDSAYCVVIGEQVMGIDKKKFADKIQSDLLMTEGITEKPTRQTMKVGGQDVSFMIYRRTAPAITFCHGVLFHGDTCLQVQSWYMTSLEKEAKATLPSAFESIRLLDAKEKATVTAKMAKAPYHRGEIGLNYGLSEGVYRDFKHGIVWRRPDGFWRVLVGDAARVQNPVATMFFEEPVTGIFGLAIVDEGLGDMVKKKYHDAVVSGIESTSLKTTEVQVGGNPGFRSTMNINQEANLAYHLYTATAEDNGIQVHFWGFPGNMKNATAAIDSAMKGLKFSKNGFPKTTRDGRIYTDHRLRFTLELPSKSTRVQDLTPNEIASIGSILRINLPNHASIQMIAMCALQDFQDLDWFNSYVTNSFAKLGKNPQHGESTIAGVPCRTIRFASAVGITKIFTFTKSQNYYSIVITEDDDEAVKKHMTRIKLL